MNTSLKKILGLIVACSFNISCSAVIYFALPSKNVVSHYHVISKEKITAIDHFLGDLFKFSNPYVLNDFHTAVHESSPYIDISVMPYAQLTCYPSLKDTLINQETGGFDGKVLSILKILVSKDGKQVECRNLNKNYDNYIEFEIDDNRSDMIRAMESVDLISKEALDALLQNISNPVLDDVVCDNLEVIELDPIEVK